MPNTFLHLMHQQGSGWCPYKNRARVCAHSTSLSETVCSNCCLGCVWHLRFFTGKYNTFLVTFWGGTLEVCIDEVLILGNAVGKMVNRGLP